MKQLAFILSFLLAGIMSTCQTDNPPSPDNEIKDIKLSKTDNSVVAASNQLGFDLMKNLVINSDEHKNLLISPLSISYALSMSYNGAKADTKTEMARCLNLDDLPISDVNESFSHLTESLQNADEKVTMEIANSLWYHNTFEVQDDFIEVNQNYYDAQVSPLDFSGSDAVKTINNWVANKTRDKIDKIINSIDPLDVMFLINAVHFNGQWKYKFDEEKTSEEPFYTRNNEEIQVPTMEVDDDFLYMENEYCSGVELPYGDGNFTMILLLPDKDKHPEDIITNLSAQSWNSLISEADSMEKHIYLPKFKFSYKKGLKQTLQNLGMKKAFNSDSANFDKINPDAQDLHISKVTHKSFIDVNEKGTEAAAVTSVTIGVTSVGPSNVLRFNRPFVFAIREQSTNTIVFSGIIEKPEY